MKAFIFSLTLMILSQAQADSTCGALFDLRNKHLALPKQYKIYDPNNITQQREALMNGELEKFKNANAYKTHLPFYEDYVLHTLDMLGISTKHGERFFQGQVEGLGVEAFKRIGQKNLTYAWVMEFSYRARSIFAKHENTSFVNMQKIINAFPHDVFFPSFARSDFDHYIELEGQRFTFPAMRAEPEYVDGSLKKLSPEENDHHDFRHYFLTQKDDNAVLNPKSKFYKPWMNLHKRIKDKIAKIPSENRRYAQFVYFYILNERFGWRTLLLKSHLYPNEHGSLSNLAKQMLDYDIIMNDKRDAQSKYQDSELFRRTTRPNDFGAAFPEKNPQDILRVGIVNFIQIMKEIESEPTH